MAAFGPDNKTVATSRCNTVRLWNLDKPAEPTLLGQDTSPAHGLLFRPDGSQIMSATENGVALWTVDNANGQQPRRVLVMAHSAGFYHSAIPLIATTVKAMGEKTGAYTTDITYDAADVNMERTFEEYLDAVAAMAAEMDRRLAGAPVGTGAVKAGAKQGR